MLMELRKVRGFINGKMGLVMMESGGIMLLRGLGFIGGGIMLFMRESGGRGRGVGRGRSFLGMGVMRAGLGRIGRRGLGF